MNTEPNRSTTCALLLDEGNLVPRWQYEALNAAIAAGLVVSIVVHGRAPNRRRQLRKHAVYYALAAVSRATMRQLSHVDVSPLIPPAAPVISFDIELEGIWQRIPDSVTRQFVGLECVLKFGMGLLRDPDSIPVAGGVVSYHHGDPECFRGRPAGYYELESKSEVVGVIVQRLSNLLDGGEILAAGFSQVRPWSYSKTLGGVLDAGVPLLAIAVQRGLVGSIQAPETLGPNYRLPANFDVVKFIAMMGWAKARRVVYGLAREKQWRVGRYSGPWDPTLRNQLRVQDCEVLPLPRGATFVADPVGPLVDGVLCEVLNARSGLGEIHRWNSVGWTRIDHKLGGGHTSYPFLVNTPFGCALFPEVAATRSPALVPFSPTSNETLDAIPLSGLQSERLIDATLFQRENHWFLFGGRAGAEERELRLWVANDVQGPYHEHPDSPVCIDPRRARMAGPLFMKGGVLYRPGQDCAKDFGSQVVLHAIEEITPSRYIERPSGSLSMIGVKGPHTATPADDSLWVDFYTERWSAAAGLRRLRARTKRLASK